VRYTPRTPYRKPTRNLDRRASEILVAVSFDWLYEKYFVARQRRFALPSGTPTVKFEQRRVQPTGATRDSGDTASGWRRRGYSPHHEAGCHWRGASLPPPFFQQSAASDDRQPVLVDVQRPTRPRCVLVLESSPPRLSRRKSEKRFYRPHCPYLCLQPMSGSRSPAVPILEQFR